MRNLYTFVPAAMVDQDFRELANSWPTWESSNHQPPLVNSRVHFEYNGDYGSERVLIASGCAHIIPDDGSDTIIVRAGDAIYLHYKFSCVWHVLEPMVQHYGYFDKNGEEIAKHTLICDICYTDCYSESYFFDNNMDVCVSCYKLDQQNGTLQYTAAEYQRKGKPAKYPHQKRPSSKSLRNSILAKESALTNHIRPEHQWFAHNTALAVKYVE